MPTLSVVQLDADGFNGAEHKTSLAEFLHDNREDPALCAQVAELKEGRVLRLNNGAGGRWEIKVLQTFPHYRVKLYRGRLRVDMEEGTDNLRAGEQVLWQGRVVGGLVRALKEAALVCSLPLPPVLAQFLPGGKDPTEQELRVLPTSESGAISSASFEVQYRLPRDAPDVWRVWVRLSYREQAEAVRQRVAADFATGSDFVRWVASRVIDATQEQP